MGKPIMAQRRRVSEGVCHSEVRENGVVQLRQTYVLICETERIELNFGSKAPGAGRFVSGTTWRSQYVS